MACNIVLVASLSFWALVSPHGRPAHRLVADPPALTAARGAVSWPFALIVLCAVLAALSWPAHRPSRPPLAPYLGRSPRLNGTTAPSLALAVHTTARHLLARPGCTRVPCGGVVPPWHLGSPRVSPLVRVSRVSSAFPLLGLTGASSPGSCLSSLRQFATAAVMRLAGTATPRVEGPVPRLATFSPARSSPRVALAVLRPSPSRLPHAVSCHSIAPSNRPQHQGIQSPSQRQQH